ncbi:hypothetical protein I4U23_026739 [Adineta vaga]|nr:hypothetical protein I4U23_026739 [Adineta vaga]
MVEKTLVNRNDFFTSLDSIVNEILTIIKNYQSKKIATTTETIDSFDVLDEIMRKGTSHEVDRKDPGFKQMLSYLQGQPDH